MPKQQYEKWFKPIISRNDLSSAIDFKRMPRIVRPYEVSSLVDMIEFSEKYSGDRSEYGDNESEDVGRSSWHGTKSFDHCIRMMRDGFGIGRIKEMMSESLENIDIDEVLQEEYRFENTGLCVDVGKFMEGSPEAFLDSEEVYENERIVQIDVFGSYDCSVSSDTVMSNMVDLIKHLRRYEQQKIRVKIVMWICSQQQQYRGKYVDTYANLIKVNIKGHDEDYNLHKIACFFHTSFFRRVVFKFMEHSGQVTEESYGQPLKTCGKRDMFFLDTGRTAGGQSAEELVDKKM